MWMQTHMPMNIANAYSTLRVGAAKADFWRYCVLYKQGGVYLDIDSIILAPIKNFVEATDQAVVSRETNVGCFLNWLFAFQTGHPILKRAIEIVTENIEQRNYDNIVHLTGPVAFTRALEEVMSDYLRYTRGLWYLSDEDLNTELNSGSTVRCKFVGTDFQDAYSGDTYALWKMPHNHELYLGATHWFQEPNIFKDATCG